jgi:hypothetical protein
MYIETSADYAAGNGEIIGVRNITCYLNLLYHQRWLNKSIIITNKSIFYKAEIKISIENCKIS